MVSYGGLLLTVACCYCSWVSYGSFVSYGMVAYPGGLVSYGRLVSWCHTVVRFGMAVWLVWVASYDASLVSYGSALSYDGSVSYGSSF